MGIIVVGVDGSEGAAIALDFAMKEAALRGSKLRLVSAWEIPASVLASVVAGKEFYEEFRETPSRVARDAAELVAEQEPDVEHEEIVVEGQAAKVLLGALRRRGAHGRRHGAGTDRSGRCCSAPSAARSWCTRSAPGDRSVAAAQAGPLTDQSDRLPPGR